MISSSTQMLVLQVIVSFVMALSLKFGWWPLARDAARWALKRKEQEVL